MATPLVTGCTQPGSHTTFIREAINGYPPRVTNIFDVSSAATSRSIIRAASTSLCKSIARERSSRWLRRETRIIPSRAYGASVGDRWPRSRRPPTSRDRILYLASRRCPISRDCTLRLGLLTTDLLRARRVPCPRGTCQRFRLYRLAPWGPWCSIGDCALFPGFWLVWVDTVASPGGWFLG